MLEIVRDLCRSATGSRCNPPKLSPWKLVNPSQSSIGVDLADIATGGAGAVVPANIKAYGSYFLTGLENDRIGLSSQAKGYGAGLGLGAGWGLPFVGGRAVGRVPNGIKRELIKRIGGAAQGKIVDMITGMAGVGGSGGTYLVAGPNAATADLSTSVFHNAWATIFSFGANFVVNGVTAGMIVFSSSKPVIDKGDLVHADALGLIAGVGLATSLDIEISSMSYRVAFM